MKIEILLMCYNSEKFIKQVIESWRRVGTMNIYIDRKTTDKTEEIVRRLGLIPKFFYFKDFATSRNEILDLHSDPDTFRIFIDDSYILIGDPRSFARELRRRNDSVISIKLVKDYEFFTFPKITKGKVRYEGPVHELITSPSTYQIDSAYIRELTCEEHLIRTLKRIPNDYEILTNEYYKDPTNCRTVYYTIKSLLVFLNYKQEVPYRMIKFWLIQMITMKNSGRKNWARIQLNILEEKIKS